jgi:hypothetical protein
MRSARAQGAGLIILAALLAASSATAMAGTNFPALADYPAPGCIKPGDKPTMPTATPKAVSAGGMTINTGARDVKDYNRQVAQYNVALQDYTACMNTYVSNAQADMDAIRNRVNQAVEQGKLP